MDHEVDLNEGDDDSNDDAAVSPIDIVASIPRSVKRHQRLGLTVLGATAVLGVLVATQIPSKYEAESRILFAQSAAVTAALSNPDAPVPKIDPFAGAAELMMQKSTVQEIVKEAGLLRRWQESRSTLFRWKDAIMASLSGPPTDEDRNSALVDMVRSRMSVGNDSTVLAIRIAWTDPGSAYKLTQIAQNRFFEMRKAHDLGAIGAAISLNEDEVKHTAEGIDRSLIALLEVREKRKKELAASSSGRDVASPAEASEVGGKPSAAGAAAPRRTAAAVVPSGGPRAAASAPPASPPPEVSKLTGRLAEMRRQIQEVEGPWQRRLAELKYQLEDIRVTYGPAHPTVVQHEAKIREATNPPAELLALREQERQTLAEIERASAAPTVTTTDRPAGATRVVATGPRPMAQAIGREETGSRLQTSNGTLVIAEKEEDPIVAPVKANLDAAILAYGQAVRRLENARIQLATAQVAFQYKYDVVTEPEVPKKPSKPNRLVLVLGALIGSLVAGVLACIVKDLSSGRIYEPWQVRAFGLRVLGDVALANRPRD